MIFDGYECPFQDYIGATFEKCFSQKARCHHLVCRAVSGHQILAVQEPFPAWSQVV